MLFVYVDLTDENDDTVDFWSRFINKLKKNFTDTNIVVRNFWVQLRVCPFMKTKVRKPAEITGRHRRRRRENKKVTIWKQQKDSSTQADWFDPVVLRGGRETRERAQLSSK